MLMNANIANECEMISLLLPTVPIIDSVEVAVLSLFEVEVNISLLTNGGQNVTLYTVSWCLCVEYVVERVVGVWCAIAYV